jgi:MoaA/NifB/PqqE/SkfB family radical SAM enzyme
MSHYKNFENIKPIDLNPKQQFLLKESKVFCMLPWVHLYMNADGSSHPCCLTDFSVAKPLGDCNTTSMEEIWNSEGMRQLRNDMLIGQASKSCNKCYEQEKFGFISQRQSANRRHGHHIPIIEETKLDGSLDRFEMRYWDLRFSNLCNLRCRSCGPQFSSQWYQDQIRIYGQGYADNHQALLHSGRWDTDIFDQLMSHIDHVEHIYFAGGEPLIMEEHYRILDELIRRKRFDVRLVYNTNFTQTRLRGRSVFDYWRQFQTVAVGASLDAMGTRAEYIRKGTHWPDVENNRRHMIEVCPNVDFYISSTISILNAWHIPDFHRNWTEQGLIKARDFNINLLQGPDWLRLDIAPQHYKELVKEKIQQHLEWLKPQDDLTRATLGFESVINFMMNDDKSDYLSKFWEYNGRIDTVRNESLFDAIPELKNLLEPTKTFCMLPWISLETSATGSIRPCCLARDNITNDQGEKFSLTNAALSEVQNSNYMRNLRRELLEGRKPDTCASCWNEERSGRVSKRMNTTHKLRHLAHQIPFTTDPGPLLFLDLKLGNLCNLKCRICGSWASSSAAVEELQQLSLDKQRQSHHYDMLRRGNWPQDNPGFWQQIQELLGQIRYIEFSGGEPFMIMQHFDLLEKIIQYGQADKVEIHYNTNGTQWPARGPDIWKHFQKVEIAFSIDDIDHRFEYQRTNAKWQQVCDTLDRFKALRGMNTNIKLQSCSTVNVFNVMYLPQLANWLDRQGFDYIYWNMLHEPLDLSCASLSDDAKQIACGRLKESGVRAWHRTEFARIINFMQQASGQDNKKLLRKIQELDRRRHTDLRNHHPELAAAIGYEGN